MQKNLQKYKNFQAKFTKTQAFSIALIDKLIYNRICVNSVGLCAQKAKSDLKGVFPDEKFACATRTDYFISKESLSMKKGTKILSLAAALTLSVSAFALTGCSEDSVFYLGEETKAEYDAAMELNDEVSSNGGFVVEKGGYVYFINGSESTTAINVYGFPVKGSLMRIAKSDLTAGNYDKAKIVIPSLITSQVSSGLYIYGDYVYYATPTTDQNVAGEIGNSFIDFKRAKLDGTEAPMAGYYFRKGASTVYRYVQVDGVDRNNDGEDDVFCLYEESVPSGTSTAKALQSYNTATGEVTMLVKGAESYIYDTKDLDNPNVYYTMPVTYDAEKGNPTAPGYNQIYCVNAAAQLKSIDATKASYTVADKAGNDVRTYDFDEKEMTKNAAARGYNLGDYTTYPYVNLGELVLDGVGYLSAKHTHYNEESAESVKANAAEVNGYTYAIKRYETSGDNVGLYFTRVAYNKDNAVTQLCYVEESEALANGWNTVSANKTLDVLGVSSDIPDNSLIEISTDGNGKRLYTYMYTAVETAGSVSNRVIKKVTVKPGESKPISDIKLTKNVLADKEGNATSTEVTLWQTKGDYLYYYKSGSKGNNLLRINYKGDANDYHEFVLEEKYQPMNIPFVEYNGNWYQPEFVGDMLLYGNVQNYGDSTASYNYVYAAPIGDLDAVKTANAEYEKYQEFRKEYESDSDVTSLIDYLFGCELDVTEDARTEYIKKFNKTNNDGDKEGEELYKEIVGKFRAEEGSTVAPEIKTATAYTNCISRITDSDEDKIAEAWDGLLLYPEEEDAVVVAEDNGWVWWIVAGGALVLIVIVALVVRNNKKKKAAKREADAIVNSYKRQRIDTMDDKSIDVYADDSAEEKAEEETEAPVEESASEEVAEPVAEVVEETAETPVEEPVAEPATEAEQEEKTE